MTRLQLLIAEDDHREVELLRHALTQVKVAGYHIVPDGHEVIEYLQRKGKYSDVGQYPQPSCLVIDLNMPRMNGFEVLKWMKHNPQYSIIPTLVLTTRPTPATIKTAYEMGAQTVFARPDNSQDAADLIVTLGRYWVRALFREDGTPTRKVGHL